MSTRKPPQYPPEANDLAHQLIATLAAWDAGTGSKLPPADRNWRIAEALHLLTWHRPLAHAPLGLLLDEERQAAASGFAA